MGVEELRGAEAVGAEEGFDAGEGIGEFVGVAEGVFEEVVLGFGGEGGEEFEGEGDDGSGGGERVEVGVEEAEEGVGIAGGVGDAEFAEVEVAIVEGEGEVDGPGGALGGGEAGYGYMLSLVGVGAIFAALTAPRLERRSSLASLYVAGIVGSGLGFFVYANAGLLWLAILAAGLHALPWFLRQIVIDSIVQQWAPPHLRGRVFAILQMERPLGLLLFTGLFSAYIDGLGPVVLLNLAGVIYTAVGLWVLSRIGILRWVQPWNAQE